MPIAHFVRALITVLGFAAVLTTNEYLNETLHDAHSRRNSRKHHYMLNEGWYDPYYKHEVPLKFVGRHLSQRDNQMLLRHESHNRTGGVECCPAVLEMIEPDGGKNQDDQYVELYRDGDYRQRFYELSCHNDILGKPCRFMDKKLHEHSKCVQKYSYTYALVKDPGRNYHQHRTRHTSSEDELNEATVDDHSEQQHGDGSQDHSHHHSHPHHHQHHHHQRLKNFPSFPGSGTTWTLDYIRVRSGCGCVVTPNAKKKRHRFNNNSSSSSSGGRKTSDRSVVDDTDS